MSAEGEVAEDAREGRVTRVRRRVIGIAAVGIVVIAAAVIFLTQSAERVISGIAASEPRCTTRVDYAGDPRDASIINAIGESTGHCPTPVPESTGLPGLVEGAALGQPCYNFPTYVFGQSSDGMQLVCVKLGGGSSATGRWVASETVVGVREVGGQCSPPTGGAAQSLDGLPLICVNSSWEKSAMGAS
ncbi:hypothetical protein [Mycolicibacterium arenosum]|uniref:Serine/threonine protein kinase n=1 Tax=Mycolicibacterium arenosum TaxID=2952157 RepID=A0ABT1MCL5_9MYCO|nr:hypothetical protein [Mycolicibacterium sp. CAU 1645]MCP9276908.1 hypothetical protein [Mycolicibacterium sp. CAU 1645]